MQSAVVVHERSALGIGVVATALHSGVPSYPPSVSASHVGAGCDLTIGGAEGGDDDLDDDEQAKIRQRPGRRITRDIVGGVSTRCRTCRLNLRHILRIQRRARGAMWWQACNH